ncbi:hypothetical protein TRICI_002697 [Trichomonascus ciferrii]|uniref:Uncharacterized protein n=1 Tax=Trichomonascus ciferrii TaxID=44093 RepID=A0A642VBS5_9ASCO|nr:hypothetical protein TRICI_002697 [Trichomonascus ciferrii]
MLVETIQAPLVRAKQLSAWYRPLTPYGFFQISAKRPQDTWRLAPRNHSSSRRDIDYYWSPPDLREAVPRYGFSVATYGKRTLQGQPVPRLTLGLRELNT